MLLKSAIIALAHQCAPSVNPQTMAALIASESSGNPYAIGVVGMQLAQQPANAKQAIEVAKKLIADGRNISVGLSQVNQSNFARYGLTVETAFDPCPNVTVGGQILSDCYTRATAQFGEGQEALKAAFSCYYSNNFKRGFVKEDENKPSYVMKIAVNNAQLKNVPEIQFTPNEIKEVPPSQKKSIEQSKSIKALETVSAKPREGNGKDEENSVSWDVLNDFKN